MLSWGFIVSKGEDLRYAGWLYYQCSLERIDEELRVLRAPGASILVKYTGLPQRVF